MVLWETSRMRHSNTAAHTRGTVPSAATPPPAGAHAVGQSTRVSRAVSDERQAKRVQMGHDDLSGLAHGNRLAVVVQNLEDDVLAGHVHGAGGALMGDETGLPAAITIRHRYAEVCLDPFTLVVVEPFARDEDRAESSKT